MVAPARRPSTSAPVRRAGGTALADRPQTERRTTPRERPVAPARRPALRVVDARRTRVIEARQRRARLLAFGGGFALLVSLLGTAASHALLVSGQAHLDDLHGRVAEAQARYSRTRLHVAELEAPERIVRQAQDRLGMIPPPRVTYLSPSRAVAAEVGSGDANEPAPTPATAGGTWARMKPFLASQQAR
jgi:hypothetical protein